MENPEVAQVFDEVADLLEIQGANPFRVRAYRNAARTVRDHSDPLAGASEKELTELPGIGEDLAGKIKTLLDTGDLPVRRKLRQQVPAGLRDLVTLPNVGPKRAVTLHRRLHIGSLDQLRKAAEAHRIRKLPGFGARMEEKILQALQGREETGRRVLLAEAKVYADAIVRHLLQCGHSHTAVEKEQAPRRPTMPTRHCDIDSKRESAIGHVEVAGSFRRRKETVGDLDLLATCRRPGPVMDRLADYEGVAEVLARGQTKMTVRLRTGLQMDLRVVAEESYGAALQYFTGSKEHSIQLRRRALDRGLKINEYGVFRGDRRIAGRTEEEVYEAVGVPWIPPELREARGEIEKALEGRLPTLLKLDDIRGDLHMHTTATDGRASPEAMVRAAKKRGYAYIAITDHSKRVTVARGLDARHLRQHWKALDELSGRLKGITVLKGVELDILEDGTMDLPDEVLRDADWVVASIHYGQSQSREQITRRLVRAVKNPHVHAIGHPTGRLIGKRKGYDVDLETVFRAAADHGCLLELNGQPDRLDLDDTALMAAKEHGVRIVVSTDAHAVEELGFMEFGVYQARRGGLEAGDVANTRSLAQFRRLLKK